MILDRFGCPLEVGQSVVFEWGDGYMEGKVLEVKELVGNAGDLRRVVIGSTVTFPLPNELGANPKLPFVVVPAAQPAQSRLKGN
jgi:hypothetical protein